jgi:hypothetical protein
VTKKIKRIERQTKAGYEETVRLNERVGQRRGNGALKRALLVEKMTVFPVLEVGRWF